MPESNVDVLNADSFVELSKQISSDNVIDFLADVSLNISQLTNDQITKAFNPSVLDELIRLTNSVSLAEQFEAVDYCRQIIQRVFPLLSTVEVLEQCRAELLVIFTSAPDRLKEVVLCELVTSINKDQSSAAALKQGSGSAILIGAIRQVEGESVAVFECVKKFIIALAKADISFISCDSFLTEIRILIAKKDIVRFRVHEITVGLCKISESHLNACDEQGLIESLTSELDKTSDILAQLTCLELLIELCTDSPKSAYCVHYLHRKGLLKRLHDMLVYCQEAPEGGFVYPAIIRFFGHLGRIYPGECAAEYPRFLASVFDLVDNYRYLDVSQRLLCFDTISLFGSTPDGKLVLKNHEKAMKMVMTNFKAAVVQGPIEMRARHLDALADILTLEESDQTPELLAINEQWYLWFSATLEPLKGIFEQPVSETHKAVGNVFKAISVQLWAQRLMVSHPGFFEFLLSRENIVKIDGENVKFEVVLRIVSSKCAQETFGNEKLLKLKEHLREGPFYVQRQHHVAMEEA